MEHKKMKTKSIWAITAFFAVIAICATAMAYKNHRDYNRLANNAYNMSFYELVDYMNDVQNYLAKSLITTDAIRSSETLNYIWREANLAQICLSQIPIANEGLSNTQKFLNQASEYSYTLARKGLEGENLSEAELKNLKDLYHYSLDINLTLSQLSIEIESGTLNWKELSTDGSTLFAKQNNTASKNSFDEIEQNFKEYDGLIYDGAYSEHMTNESKKGLTGEDIDEVKAQEIVEEFVQGKDVKEIKSNGFSENGKIETYTFSVEFKNNQENIMSIGISKKGGHVIFMNDNRNVIEEVIGEEEANQKAITFLESKGFTNLEKTYFIKQGGIMTINYAYQQDDVIIYPDLIKIKIALDNGEILGMETTGYLNNHEKRNISKAGMITKEEALKTVNKDLKIESSRLAIIPTEFRTEIFCWELKGKVEEREFLVYVNCKTGRVEDILVIVSNENGTLTE